MGTETRTPHQLGQHARGIHAVAAHLAAQHALQAGAGEDRTDDQDIAAVTAFEGRVIEADDVRESFGHVVSLGRTHKVPPIPILLETERYTRRRFWAAGRHNDTNRKPRRAGTNPPPNKKPASAGFLFGGEKMDYFAAISSSLVARITLPSRPASLAEPP